MTRSLTGPPSSRPLTKPEDMTRTRSTDSSVDPRATRLGRGLHVLRATARIPRPPEEVFPFFAEADNLERITPPELRFRIVTPRPVHMERGALIDYRLRLYGLPFGWRTEITEWDPPCSFTDSQLRGPYHTWIHRHVFTAEGDATVMVDEVRYRLPWWPFGGIAMPVVARQLERIFTHRAAAIGELLG